jgi:hypothetical protein
MTSLAFGLPPWLPNASTLRTMSLLGLLDTLPNTTCLPSSLKLDITFISEIILRAIDLPGRLHRRDEKLRAIAVLAAVCHGHDEFVVFQNKVFVLKRVAVDAEMNH